MVRTLPISHFGGSGGIYCDLLLIIGIVSHDILLLIGIAAKCDSCKLILLLIEIWCLCFTILILQLLMELHLIWFDLEANVVVDNSWLLNIIVLLLAWVICCCSVCVAGEITLGHYWRSLVNLWLYWWILLVFGVIDIITKSFEHGDVTGIFLSVWYETWATSGCEYICFAFASV